MTIANVNIKKVLFRRGNTIQNDNYVGVFGEVSVDTQANTLRVHDGATAGGTRLATYAELTDAVTGNLDLTGYATTAQITAANVEIGKLRANITAANVAWTANAATQATAINTINANIGAFHTYANATFTGGGGSTYSNTNVVAYLESQSITSANIGAFQVYANANAASQTTEIDLLRANITAANTAITGLQSNAAIQAALLDTLTGNAATQSQVLDTLTSNAAIQSDTLTTLLSNAVAQQTSLIDLVANAATQAQQIANVSGTYGNANVQAYMTVFDGNILPAANVTYSLGSEQFQWRDLWVSNNTIYIGGTPVRVDGGTLLINNTPVSGGAASSLVNGASTFQLFANGQSRSPDTIFAANGVSIIDANGVVQGGIYNSGDADFFNIAAGNGRGIKFYVNEEGEGPKFFANGNIQVPGNITAAANVMVIGTGDAKLTLDSFNQAALLQAKKTFNRSFDQGDGASFVYSNVAGTGSITATITSALYLKTLLERLSSQFSTPTPEFTYSYSNVRVQVYDVTNANVIANVTGVDNYGNPDEYTLLIDQPPTPDPFSVLALDISYDYLNTVGVDVDKDLFGITTDNDDIDIKSGRDIDLQARDDFFVSAGSEFIMRLNANDGQNPTDGIILETQANGTTRSWAYRFDGATEFPSGLTAEPLGNYVPVNGTVLQQTENEILQVLSKGSSGGMSIGWAENPFVPSQTAALTFNSVANQVQVITGNYAATTYSWTFGTDGNLTLPNGTLIRDTGSVGTSGIGLGNHGFNIDFGSAVNDWAIMSGANLIQVQPDTAFNISFPEVAQWQFNIDGNLTFPDGTKQITAYTGGGGGGTYGNANVQALLASNVSLIGSSSNIILATLGAGSTTTVTQEGGTPGVSGQGTITGASSNSPGVALVQPGWTVTGNNLVGTTTVTNVSGPDGFGTYTITTDTTEVDPFWYNDVYTFTSNTPSYSNITVSSGNIINAGTYGQINFVANSSGDGYGLSTIQLVPYTAGYDSAYIIIDPTYPNHIHIRAGGEQDNSPAQLFLGGENSYFSVDSGLDPNVYIRSNNNDWTFGTDGNLTLSKITPHGGINRGIIWDWGLGQAALGLGEGEGSNSYIRQTENGLEIHPNEPGAMGNGDLRIRTGNVSPGGTSYEWIFNGSGGLTFPTGGNIVFDSSAVSVIDGVSSVAFADSTVQTTAWTGDQAVNMTSSPQFAGLTTTANVEMTANVRIHQNLTVDGNINFVGNVTQNTVTTANAVFTGDTYGFGALYAGVVGYTPLPYTVIQATSDYDDYSQINFQNLNLSANASTEWVATAGNGNDTTNFIDFGIAGGAWNGTQYNSIGTAAKANDGWLYILGNAAAGTGGNLVLGTVQPGKRVNILTGGPGSANIYSYFNSSGLTTANVSAANYLFANGVNILSTVSGGGGSSYANADAAAYLAANSALYLGNPGTRYINQANVTQLFVGNTTTIGAGSNQLGGTYILNNAYFGANGALYARNTQTGAAQFRVSGGSFDWAGTTGAVTANSVQSFGLWAGLNSSTFTTYNSIGITSAGTVAVNGSGGITTTQTSFPLVNATATTISFGGAATTITAGATTVNVQVGGSTMRGNISAGNIVIGGNISASSIALTSAITAATATTTGNVTALNFITTGTYGNITGANVISANSVSVTTFVRTVAVTFATLPDAAAAGAGARAFITDGNTATFGSQVSGGGANAVPVYSNGTNWYVG